MRSAQPPHQTGLPRHPLPQTHLPQISHRSGFHLKDQCGSGRPCGSSPTVCASTDTVSDTSLSISVRKMTGTGYSRLLSPSMVSQTSSSESVSNHVLNLVARVLGDARGGPGFVASPTLSARLPQHRALKSLIGSHPSKWYRLLRSNSTTCLIDSWTALHQ